MEVNSHDDLTATGNGITATSSAVAGANLEQTATQSNTNSESATGTAILQLQLVGQANFNEQEGAAIAAATSDYVDVDQSGVLTAGGNGITATSSAVAGANLDQTATQSNSNSATATLEGPGLGAAAAQIQLVGQLNVNDQDGAAIATAASSYVEVRSFEDPSQGDGITATSSAVAGANLDQSATQSNTNSASITLPALPVVPASTEIPITGLEIAAQVEGVLQANVNEQEGLAVATATSDYVSVDQDGPLSAAGNGIVATSSAVAGANLTQTADQSNTDTKTVSRAPAPVAGADERILHPQALAVQLEGVLQANANSQAGASIAAASSGSVDVKSHDDITAGGDAITATSSAVAGANLEQTANQTNDNSATATGTVALQGQLVGQLNANEQEGAAIAAATSDYVNVEQTDTLIRGGNGITATSSAVAGANLDQTANQSNSNSASATLGGSGPADPAADWAKPRSRFAMLGSKRSSLGSSTSMTRMAWRSPRPARAPLMCGALMTRRRATASPPRLRRWRRPVSIKPQTRATRTAPASPCRRGQWNLPLPTFKNPVLRSRFSLRGFCRPM